MEGNVEKNIWQKFPTTVQLKCKQLKLWLCLEACYCNWHKNTSRLYYLTGLLPAWNLRNYINKMKTFMHSFPQSQTMNTSTVKLIRKYINKESCFLKYCPTILQRDRTDSTVEVSVQDFSHTSKQERCFLFKLSVVTGDK